MKPIFPPALLALAFLFKCAIPASAAPPARPNIVLVFADDLGWGDLGSYGARSMRTPHLDRLAREGTRFTSFYVAQPVCSASRAALLTGCYANRVGIHGALGPNARMGISSNEVTVAEVLQARGYATAIFGKWHLGREPQFLPTRHGFDEYFGLPYSNDMWPRHPTARPGTYPPLPLLEGERVLEEMPDQRQLTTRYTERAVAFIERHKDQPFFLYLAHSMPHVPLHVSDKFAGKSRRGLYGDVIEEIDWSVGQVLEALRRHKLEDNTWVIFTSDNGPWLSYGDHAGSAGPWREGKGTVFEGGVREPCLMRWPGRIPRGRVCDEPLMTIDLFPTLAGLVGAELPAHKIDGRDVWPVLSGQRGATNPTPAYFFYFNQGELQALRSGPWKLHLPHTARVLKGRPGGREGRPAPYDQLKVGLELYNLDRDPGETTDVAAHHAEVVQRLLLLVEEARGELGDALTKRKGAGVRQPGRVVAAK
jgi:arylsulfatase